MAVRQVAKNQVTKDGRSWVFNVIIYDINSNEFKISVIEYLYNKIVK